MGRMLKKKSSSTSSKKPSFFKIMIGDFDEKLRVPKCFIRHFNGKLPHKSILRSPTGRSWTIQVKKIAKDLFFSNGWKEFVIHHSLEFGDFLVFRYNGESKFNVKIYGRTGCEKEVHCNDHEEPMSNVKIENHEDEQMLNLNKEKEEPRKPVMEIQKKAGAGVRASSIKTKRSHLIATWRSSRQYHVVIPRALAIENGLKTKKSIVLQDPEGKSWPMIISLRSDGRADMTNGWQKFSVENRLVDGDAILFDFLHLRKGNKISVRILRKAEGKIPARLLHSKGLSSTVVLKGSSSTAVLKGSSSTAVLKGSSSTAALDLLTKSPKPAHVTTKAEERAIKAASTFKSENPFCLIIMRKSFVHEPCLLNVPSKFGSEYLKGKTQFVTLQVSDEGTWQVRCGFSGYHTKLYKGWRKFVSDNHLEEGDVCVFELVERKNFEIKVSIFRVSQYVENIEGPVQTEEKD